MACETYSHLERPRTVTRQKSQALTAAKLATQAPRRPSLWVAKPTAMETAMPSAQAILPNQLELIRNSNQPRRASRPSRSPAG